IGFPLLPGYVWLTFGGFELKYLWIIPILVFVSFPAHIANEIPDYELDKEYNKKNFAVYIGKKIATILYWISILLIEIILLIVFFLYNLNLWILLSVVLSSVLVGSIALYLLWKNNWHTSVLIFNLVTVCIGIEVIGFFILLAV
ncbi:MAG: UbiA family prenyltransferase, partial [Candidatus Thorarchaeota archaeon]